MKSGTRQWVLFLGITFFVLTACRLGEALTQNQARSTTVAQYSNQTQSTSRTATPTGVEVSGLQALAEAATEAATETPEPTQTAEPTETVPGTELETDVPPPNVAPASVPNSASAPTLIPSATPSPTATVTPTPEFPYYESFAYCGPNYQTFIEGYVYEKGTAKNGLIVRISMSPDGDPSPNDDYVTGTDPKRPGHFFHNIDANRPHPGLWYLFLLDPDTKKRVSDIAIVKTDAVRIEDDAKTAGSCQSATINFDTYGYKTQPTALPTGTLTRTPTRTGTPPTSTPTATGTPHTATPTATPSGSVTVTPTATPTTPVAQP